jgi:hypothetical protein
MANRRKSTITILSQFVRLAAPAMLATVLSALALSLFLQFAAAAPTAPVVEDVESITKRFSGSDFQELSVGELRVHVADRVSDCVTLGHMFSESEIPFGNRRQLGSDPISSQCNQLSWTVQSTENFNWESYARFWHGSSAILLLAGQFVPLEVFALLIGSCTVGLAILLSYRLLVLSPKLAIPIVITIFLGTDFLFGGFSYSQGLSVATMMLALIVLAFSNPLLPSRVAFISSLAGLAYSFLAQLFYPMAFALLFHMVVGTTRFRQPNEEKTQGFPGAFPSGTLALGFWIFGYGFGMLSRFVDIAIRTSPSVAIAELQSSSENKESFHLGPVLRAGYHHLLGSLPQYSFRWLALIALTFALGYYIARLDRLILRIALPLVVASLLPVGLWVLVFSEHNIHGWVANVTLMTACFIVWLFANTSRNKAEIVRM